MYVDGAARSHEASSRGSNDIAEALMLLRASTLKIIRLQLAIERRDRQVALMAVDDLVTLDQRLQVHLTGIPTTEELLALRRELDFERAALSAEKLTLAAEIRRRPTDGGEPEDPVGEPDVAEAGDDWHEPAVPQVEREERRRGRWWLAAILILVLASAAAAAAYYRASLPDVAAWLTEAARALR